MPIHDWFPALSEEISHSLNELYLPALQTFIRDQGLEGLDVWLAQSALSAEPQPMTAVIILDRAPYMNEALIQKQMTQAAVRGVLTAVAPHTYRLTPQGRHFAQTIPNIVHNAYQAIDDVIPAEVYRLVELLNSFVKASLAATEPLHKSALQRSRFYDPGPQGHILERLRRALNDLAAFYDDAHLASWHAYKVTGIAWEAFSHIDGRFTYGDPVNSATELAQKLSYRGYDAVAYQQALHTIVARGWLSEADGLYRLTPKGDHVRQTAESETNRLFYAPWPLDDGRLAELRALLEKVNQALQPPSLALSWQLVRDLRHQISRHYLPALRRAITETDLPPLGLFLLMQGQMVAPQALKTRHIVPITPYMAESTIQARFAALIEAGFLTVNHYLTPAAHSTIAQLTQIVKDKVAELPVPTEVVQQTADFLAQLVQNSLAVSDPDHKPALQHAYFHAAADQDILLFQLLRAMAQLIAFRDDAHVAAWSTLEIPGHQWELFSHIHGRNIWGEPIGNVRDAAEKFAFRGYDTVAYTVVLQDCVDRGWLVMAENDRYTTTSAGQVLWQEIEAHTDQLFYNPWQSLTVLERFELHQLLTKLYAVISNS